MDSSRGRPGAFSDDRSPEACWLVIGSGTAEALKEHWARRAGASGEGQAPILQVRTVHDALNALMRGPVAACVVSAGVIEARPGAALRVLREQLGAAPLVMLDGEEAVAAPAVEPAGVSAGAASPLPRADADKPETHAVDAGRFAEGCLQRISRLCPLVTYIVRTLSEASNASRISLMLTESGQRTLRLRAGRGIHESLLGTVRCAVGTGIAGRVASIGRPASGHGSTGGPRGYQGSAYVVLPLGNARHCEGVVSLTGLPEDALPSTEALRAWAGLGRRAGLALRGARRLQRARSLSTRDALTGLPNRRAFEGALKRELERARRAGSGLALGIVDVDHFKSFNDRYGHLVGDRVLTEVARRLETAFRETDLVARWGGEEFAVLLPSPSPDDAAEAQAVLERARIGVGGRPFQLGDGLAPARVTISGGLAAFPGVDAGPDALIRTADEALYRAKDAGRDRIVSS